MPSLNISTIDTSLNDAEALLAELREKLSPHGDVVSEAGRRRTVELFGEPLSPQQVVERICGDVRAGGLAAVLDYTKSLDGCELTAETMRVSEDELREAHAAADEEYLATIRRIRENIREFQRAVLRGQGSGVRSQESETESHEDRRSRIEARDPGPAILDPRSSILGSVIRKTDGGRIELRQRCLPLRRVGVCVPGGAAAYPSTVLMTAVPAQVAGVSEIAVVVPPTGFGGYNRDLLAACHELGISEIYRIGGAQAVAALAYGVEGIERVDKIVGPGNLFVQLAKRHVFGEVDIDGIAGPSEVVVIADETARPQFVAADLISQAEHDPGSGVLITWHRPLLEAVPGEIARQCAALPRGEQARRCLEEYGALILVRDADEAARLSDLLAPEHLHISTADPEAMQAKVHHAGAIFLGHFTPVAAGDYVAGPSHVLPTGGTARFRGGLSALDFLKRSSVISYDEDALAAAADDIRLMAAKEGLTAHSASVDVRLA